MAIRASEYIEAIKAARGNVAAAARRLGVDRTAVHHAARRYSTVQDAIDEARETELDFAETMLQKQIREGNTTALIFFLKTQGKARGYVERQELAPVQAPEITVQRTVTPSPTAPLNEAN